MMNAKELFNLAVQIGEKNDPRGKKEIQRLLKERNDKYKKLDKSKKAFYDKELNNHVFDDSRFLAGNPDKKVKKILVGVDIETPELVLASELNRNGMKIDAIMAHHPEGRGLLGLTGVMKLQEDIFEELGVSPNVAEKLLAPRMAQIDRSLHSSNVYRPINAAELLGFPFFNIHTPADNCVYQYLKKNICEKGFRTVGEALEAIHKISEFKISGELGNPAEIFVGRASSKAGKIVPTELTGGTSGSKKMYKELSQAGVGTILAMHISEEHKKEAEKYHLNVIVCSHIAADSLGINIIMDEYEKKGVEVVPCSGFIRVKR